MTSTNVFGVALTWGVTCTVFLLNVELGQLFHRRDVVDHAAVVASDTAMKTYCAHGGGDPSGAKRAAEKAIDPLIATASSKPGECEVSIARAAKDEIDPGAAALEVAVACSFECKVPLAAQLICKQGHVAFVSKQSTVALGCDRGS